MTTKSFSANAVNLFIGTPADALTGSMTVTMKTAKYYTDGNRLLPNVSYVVTREWGKMAVDCGWAKDTNSILPVVDTPNLDPAAVSGAGISDASSLTLLTAMANSTRLPAGTLTYTIDAATGWNVSDGIAVFLPASGTVSFAVSGGPTLNGATSTLTRTLAGNAIGYVLLHRIAGTAAYSLTGA